MRHESKLTALRRAIVYSGIVFVVVSNGAAVARARAINKQELAQKAAQAVELNEKAQKQMIEQMRTVGRWLLEFRDRSGHYPQATYEYEFFQTRLGKLLPPNPFVLKPPPEEEDLPKVNKVVNLLDPGHDDAQRIKFVLDPTLTEGRLDLLKTDAPDNWATSAGDITVVCNGTDLCAILAGGCDARPMRDDKSGMVLYYLLR